MRSGPAITSPVCWSIAEHREHEAVLREVAAVAQHDVARRRRRPCRRRTRARRGTALARRAPASSISSTSPSSSRKHVVVGDARPRAPGAMAHQVAVLAVHRHEVARADEVQHRASAPPGWRGPRRGSARALVVDARAAPVEVVHQVRDRRARCPGMMRDESTTVSPGCDLHLRVLVHRDPHERRQRPRPGCRP